VRSAKKTNQRKRDLDSNKAANGRLFYIENQKIMLDFWATKVCNKITVKEDLMSKAGKSRKGGGMEGMTNEQFQIFLKMVINYMAQISNHTLFYLQ